MRQALFFDIDGTILSEITKEIPQSTFRALSKAKENGHLLFINTGRTRCTLPIKITEMPFDGFLCGCGIFLTYRDEIFYKKNLPSARADAIAKMAGECRIDGVFEGVEDVYFSKFASRFEDIEALRTKMKKRGLGQKRYLEEGGFHFIERDLDIIDRENGAYECVPKGCSKATAIQMVLDKFHLSREQSYVFGDSENDLAMFRYAGHAIAMEKHSTALDPYTEFVTKAVEEDGIDYAMKKFRLI